MARPNKYAPAVVEKICEAIRMGATYELAANYAGVSYTTFNDWHKNKPEFLQALNLAEGDAAVAWLKKIEAAAEDGAWQAAAWKLERRYPQEYGRTVIDQKHSGKVDHTVTTIADIRKAIGVGEEQQ